jgi:hypothetical protein
VDSAPLVVQQFVGAGRSMFFGFDESWRWRYRDGEPHFNQFWIQTVRFLARNRPGRIELRVDRQTPYRRGEPIKLSVQFPDDAPAPGAETKVQVVALRTKLDTVGKGRRETVEKETIRLAKLEGSRATYEATLLRTPEGDYHFSLTEPAVAGASPHAEARVLPPPGEMDDLQMNRQEMEIAATETRGQFYTLASAPRLPDDLPAGPRTALQSRQPPWLLWNHSAALVLALWFLGAEWILRKRANLL